MSRPRGKRVPTFGHAGEYMQLLWRMDAMYSGHRIKGGRSPRTYTNEKLLVAHIQDTATDEQIEGAEVEEVLAVTKHHAAE